MCFSDSLVIKSLKPLKSLDELRKPRGLTCARTTRRCGLIHLRWWRYTAHDCARQMVAVFVRPHPPGIVSKQPQEESSDCGRISSWQHVEVLLRELLACKEVFRCATIYCRIQSGGFFFLQHVELLLKLRASNRELSMPMDQYRRHLQLVSTNRW